DLALAVCSATTNVRRRECRSSFRTLRSTCPQSCPKNLRLSSDKNGSSWSIAEERDVRAASFVRLVDDAETLENSDSIAKSRNRTHASLNLLKLFLGGPRKSTDVRQGPDWRRRESNFRVKSGRKRSELPPKLPPRYAAVLSAWKIVGEQRRS